MTRFGKIIVPLVLVLPLAAGGCRPKKGTANPEDYFPLIQVALGGGETAAMIGRNEALKAKNWQGCVAAEALITAFDSAGEVLAAKLKDQVVIPSVDIDVSACLAVREAAEDSGDGDGENASVVTSSTMVAGYGPEAPAEEGTEEAAPEEGTEEGTEEAAPEEGTEEAVPEEAVPEEAVPEEADGLKGNPEAAALVETIAGITIVAVLHYAAKLQSANCKKGTAALGAINYVNGMIKPIADEIADPDGKVSVPAVTIDLSQCAEG